MKLLYANWLKSYEIFHDKTKCYLRERYFFDLSQLFISSNKNKIMLAEWCGQCSVEKNIYLRNAFKVYGHINLDNNISLN